MKLLHTKAPVLLLAFVCLFIVYTSHAQNRVKAGLCMANFATERWISDAELLKENFENMGGILETSVAHSDVNNQIKQALDFINQKVDVLIIVPVDGRRLGRVMDAAQQKGIPVITYDRILFDSRISLYVSFDNTEVGRIQARKALEKYPTGRFIIVNGPSFDFNATLFAKGQMEILKPKIDAKEVKISETINLDDWNELSAYMKAQNMKTPLKKVDAILSPTDPISNGFIMSYGDNTDFKRIYLTGQDATPAGIENIKAGKQDMTILKQISKLAEKAAFYAYQLASDEKLTGTSTFSVDGIELNSYLLSEITVITEDNINVNY